MKFQLGELTTLDCYCSHRQNVLHHHHLGSNVNAQNILLTSLQFKVSGSKFVLYHN